jgi:hypothetical protein
MVVAHLFRASTLRLFDNLVGYVSERSSCGFLQRKSIGDVAAFIAVSARLPKPGKGK